MLEGRSSVTTIVRAGAPPSFLTSTRTKSTSPASTPVTSAPVEGGFEVPSPFVTTSFGAAARRLTLERLETTVWPSLRPKLATSWLTCERPSAWGSGRTRTQKA